MQLVERDADLDAAAAHVADPDSRRGARADDARAERMGGGGRAHARTLPRCVDRVAQRPLLRHHQPPGRTHRHRQARRRGRRDRERRTRRTRSRSRRWRAKPAARSCCASTAPTSSTPQVLRDARVVGVTAGASAPEELVESVIARLAPRDGVEVVRVTDEDEYFPPPRELRELIPALDAAAALAARRRRHRGARRGRTVRRRPHPRRVEGPRRLRRLTRQRAACVRRGARWPGRTPPATRRATGRSTRRPVRGEPRREARGGLTIGSPTTITTWREARQLDPMAAQDLLGAGDARPARSAPRPAARGRPRPVAAAAIFGPFWRVPSGYTSSTSPGLQHGHRIAQRLAIGAVPGHLEAAEACGRTRPRPGSGTATPCPCSAAAGATTTPRTGCPSSSGATAPARSRRARATGRGPRSGTRYAADEPPATIRRTASVERRQRCLRGSGPCHDVGDDGVDVEVGGVDDDRVVGGAQR